MHPDGMADHELASVANDAAVDEERERERDALDVIEEAHCMVVSLCKPRGSPGSREWIMTIPARPDYDPDLVIGRALRVARQEILRLRGREDEI